VSARAVSAFLTIPRRKKLTWRKKIRLGNASEEKEDAKEKAELGQALIEKFVGVALILRRWVLYNLLKRWKCEESIGDRREISSVKFGELRGEFILVGKNKTDESFELGDSLCHGRIDP